MSGQDAFDGIVAALHDAAFDDAKWLAASALIDDACRIKGTALVHGEGDAQDGVEIFLARFCYRGVRRDDLVREYFDVYHPADERVPRLRQQPDRRLVPVRSLYTEQELRTSPAYNEALRHCEGQNGLNVRMDGPDGSRIVWATGDSVDSGEWSSDQIATIEHLMPHVRQYASVRQALVDAGALGTSLAALLENTWSGIVHLDRRGRILASNDKAGVPAPPGRRVVRPGRLSAGWAAGGQRPPSNSAGARTAALRRPGRQRVDDGEALARPAAARAAPEPRGRPGPRYPDPARVAAIALVVEPGSRVRIDRSLVSAILGLTPSETEVAVMLAEGHAVRDIAWATGRRESTVRWHIKHIFNKHGFNRQLELVQLVLSLAAIPASGR